MDTCTQHCYHSVGHIKLYDTSNIYISDRIFKNENEMNFKKSEWKK